MVHTSIFNIQELLEQILYFLAIDKTLYPALFVCRLWYRCGAPILWKHVELKGNDLYSYHYFPDNYNYCVKDRSRLERFIKSVYGKQKSIYSSNLMHLEITYYHSLSDNKIKGITDSCPNIIYLNFKSSTSFSDNALNLIAESYPNLRYLNLWDTRVITDKGLCAIAQSCYKLEYLDISYCREITEKSLYRIAGSCHELQEFHFAEARWITDKSISCILNSCPNLRNLDISHSKGDIKDASMLIQRYLSIEYLEFAGDWHFLLYSPGEISQASELPFTIEFSKKALDKESEEYQTLYKDVKKILEVIIGLIKDRVCSDKELDRKRAKIDGYRSKK